MGAFSLMMAVGGLVVWRRQYLASKERINALQNTKYSAKSTVPPVEAFKVELHQLEIDRSRGTITGQEYANAKQALEEIVRRALARVQTG